MQLSVICPLFFFMQGSFQTYSQRIDSVRIHYAQSITPERLRQQLSVIASDEFEGRETGENGQKRAAEYISKQFKINGIKPGMGDSTFFQHFPVENKLPAANSENILAYLEGTDKKEELILITAHYDHLGIKSGFIYNGADDDGSGTAAVIELAEAFSMASKEGFGPRRSILFMLFSGEENGLQGSKYYTDNPVFPLATTMVDLNIDMIGRVDARHKDSINYIYIIGSDKLSSGLHRVNEASNNQYSKLKLDYSFNDAKDPNRFYFRSDQYNFAKHDIPVIFYFNGTHEDYHKPSDKVNKIDFILLSKRAKLIFYTAWELANRNEKIIVDITNNH